MQRIIKNICIYNKNFSIKLCLRTISTQKDIFSTKIEFPSRHIGPRKTDVVSMLDLLGFKV